MKDFLIKLTSPNKVNFIVDIAPAEQFYYHYGVNLAIAPLEMRCSNGPGNLASEDPIHS